MTGVGRQAVKSHSRVTGGRGLEKLRLGCGPSLTAVEGQMRPSRRRGSRLWHPHGPKSQTF
ncbi:hypothetical protein JMJ77_0002767 [Colletotrichum scovillei]|uniref:Uncharacterized protein n=1 Tax=Colletotrichum scovillei TaxID=1209932 RepID=A0A9P7UDP5_9PEZI|nr:hypothetical protein JMJ77_0002767 [Colletotrichum scovillei]KAG7071192.1 hypothetical protein JMJ76_0002429 [Colletotrichum scovillei]